MKVLFCLAAIIAVANAGFLFGGHGHDDYDHGPVTYTIRHGYNNGGYSGHSGGNVKVLRVIGGSDYGGDYGGSYGGSYGSGGATTYTLIGNGYGGHSGGSHGHVKVLKFIGKK